MFYSVTKISMYIFNGGQHFNTSLSRYQKSTARDLVTSQDHMTIHIIAPMTSSPRSMNRYQYDNEEEVDHYQYGLVTLTCMYVGALNEMVGLLIDPKIVMNQISHSLS